MDRRLKPLLWSARLGKLKARFWNIWHQALSTGITWGPVVLAAAAGVTAWTSLPKAVTGIAAIAAAVLAALKRYDATQRAEYHRRKLNDYVAVILEIKTHRQDASDALVTRIRRRINEIRAIGYTPPPTASPEGEQTPSALRSDS